MDADQTHTTNQASRATDDTTPARGDALILGLAAEYFGCEIGGGSPDRDDALLMAICGATASDLAGIAIQAQAVGCMEDHGWPKELRMVWTDRTMDSIREVLQRKTGIGELLHHSETWGTGERPIYADARDLPPLAEAAD
jgi:hypothetical protein